MIWDDPAVDWKRFDAVIIRSTWDYHVQPAAFRAWIEKLERAKVKLFNPPKVLKWNMEKTYLAELESRGLPLPPTAWTTFEDPKSLSRLIEERGWKEIVVKPTTSAGARETYWLRAGDPAPEYKKGTPLIIQPYFPEIAFEGEWSYLFFGGKFSHCVLKRPAQGDFRVQEKHGGSTTRGVPEEDIVRLAERYLEAAPGPTLYGRVDLIRTANRVVLMELEVLEPALFLAFSPEAPRCFAEAIAAAVHSKN